MSIRKSRLTWLIGNKNGGDRRNGSRSASIWRFGRNGRREWRHLSPRNGTKRFCMLFCLLKLRMNLLIGFKFRSLKNKWICSYSQCFFCPRTVATCCETRRSTCSSRKTTFILLTVNHLKLIINKTFGNLRPIEFLNFQLLFFVVIFIIKLKLINNLNSVNFNS